MIYSILLSFKTEFCSYNW